jgi:release factor glutamine methyltransferase
MNPTAYKPEAVASVQKRLDAAKSDGISEYDCMGRRFIVNEGVFPPTHFQATGIFAQNLPYVSGASFLEIGSGAGVIAVMAALKGCAPVVASDISEAAVLNTRANADRHQVSDLVSCRHGDLFDVLQPYERFDIIFWNSPFGFVPADHQFDEDIMHAFFDPGYKTHRRFLSQVHQYLASEGTLLLGFSSIGDEDSMVKLLGDHGYVHEVIASECGNGLNSYRYDILRLLRKP